MNKDKKQLSGKFELMHVVWNSNLRPNQKNLLNYLLALADANGDCYPNTDTIAQVCSVKNQKRLKPVVDQLPGLVEVDKQGRKNYYRVNLAAVDALEPMEVVLKVTPNPFANTPPAGTNTPPDGTNTPPVGGVINPPVGGANTTVNTTNESTINTTENAVADAPSFTTPENKNDKDNQHEAILIGSNDLEPSLIGSTSSTPIAFNNTGRGAASPVDRWKQKQGIKTVEWELPEWSKPGWEPPVKKKVTVPADELDWS